MTYKIYQPYSPNKEFRFSYFPRGSKPKNYVHGLERLRKEVEAKRKLMRTEMTPEERDVWLEKNPRFKMHKAFSETTEKLKVKRLILCSGGSDGINVALLGYDVCWLNSESADLTFENFKQMQDYAENIYLLFDIDPTGQRTAHALGMHYLSLRHIILPEEEFKKENWLDWKGAPCKDVRDYLNHKTAADFEKLVDNAMPYQFWYWKKGGPEADITILRFFLNRCGFGQFSNNADDKTNDVFIQKDGYVVRPVMEKEMDIFTDRFLEYRNFPRQVRNMLDKGSLFDTKKMQKLKYLNLDFSNASEKHQIMYFKNEAWYITADEIRPLKHSDIKGCTWKQDIYPLKSDDDSAPDMDRVELMDEFFKITKQQSGVIASAAKQSPDEEDDGQYEIEKQLAEEAQKKEHTNGHSNYADAIIRYDLTEMDNAVAQFPFYQFLKNTARVHWQKEAPTPQDAREEQEHLINRLFFIGYFLHQYKNTAKAWGGFATDNNNLDVDIACGGTGKGTFLKIFQFFLRSYRPNARDRELTKNTHWLGKVDRWTRLLWMEDCARGFDYQLFYPYITGGAIVNPKFMAQQQISFQHFPKIIFDSNYPLNKLDSSSKRRLLYTAFSDLYHEATPGSKFTSSHRPIDDFEKPFFTRWDKKDWNMLANLAARCIQFNLQTGSDKLNPPMRMLERNEWQASLPKDFDEWALDYFGEQDGKDSFLRLDTMVEKEEMFKHFKLATDYKGKKNYFTRSIKSYCLMRGWEYNPLDLCTDKAEQRIRSNNKESVYIRASKDKPLPEQHVHAATTVIASEAKQSDIPF